MRDGLPSRCVLGSDTARGAERSAPRAGRPRDHLLQQSRRLRAAVFHCRLGRASIVSADCIETLVLPGRKQVSAHGSATLPQIVRGRRLGHRGEEKPSACSRSGHMPASARRRHGVIGTCVALLLTAWRPARSDRSGARELFELVARLAGRDLTSLTSTTARPRCTSFTARDGVVAEHGPAEESLNPAEASDSPALGVVALGDDHHAVEGARAHRSHWPGGGPVPGGTRPLGSRERVPSLSLWRCRA